MKLLLFAIVGLAAAGTQTATQPATQPTTQPSAPHADERVIDNAALGFRFAVPKLWKEVPQKAEAVIYVFTLPATGEARRIVPSLILTARDAKGDSIEALVSGRRDAIKERNTDAKFESDGAATVAGQDGWSFVYDTTLKQTVTPKGGAAHEEKVAVKVRDQITVIDGKAFEFVLTSDDKGLMIRSRLADRVIATLAVR